MTAREDLAEAAAAELMRVYSGVRREWQHVAPEKPVERVESGRVVYLRDRKKKAS